MPIPICKLGFPSLNCIGIIADYNFNAIHHWIAFELLPILISMQSNDERDRIAIVADSNFNAVQ